MWSAMVDRISALPDSLVCHILSFLPTEQAAATSVLSKHWRSFWLGVTDLRFDDRRYSQNKDTYSRFIHMVYTAMLLRGGEQCIKSFKLMCGSSLCDPAAVNTWLMATNQRKVEHLYLFLPKTISLPFSIFSSTTLVTLKLNGFCVKGFSSLTFPSLKILHLTMLSFQLRPQYLPQILSSCPILDVLVMKSLTFITSVGRPKHFQLSKLLKPDISNSNVLLALKPFYNVQFLRADLWLPEELPTTDHNLVNLTCMQLSFLGNYWDWLIKFLHYCPNLQSLAIDKIYESSSFRSSGDKNWAQPQSVPKCILLQLKRFSVKNYEEMKSELQFTKYILRNARVLREVTICCSGSSNPQDKFQMIQKLTLCRRGSVLCQLRFE